MVKYTTHIAHIGSLVGILASVRIFCLSLVLIDVVPLGTGWLESAIVCPSLLDSIASIGIVSGRLLVIPTHLPISVYALILILKEIFIMRLKVWITYSKYLAIEGRARI